MAIAERCTITRLGQGVDRTGRLDPTAVVRTLSAVREYARIARSLGAEPRAVGTSALRDAANRDDFLVPAREALGNDVRLLSGDEEAFFTYRGALVGLADPGVVRTVVDIGGGSTEVVTAIGGEVISKVSLQIGAVRLAERFFRSDPPLAAEVEQVRAAAASALGAAQIPPGELVAVAGTATSLAALSLQIEPYDPRRVHGLVLARQEITRLVDLLVSIPLEARKRLRGIEPARADVLPAGALILDAAIERAGASSVRISDRGLRWGLLGELHV